MLEDTARSSLGTTGKTVIYIFPDGGAMVDQPEHPPTTKLNATEAIPSSARTASDLGDHLVQAGILTAVQKQVALYDQQVTGMDFKEVLLARGWVREDVLTAVLADLSVA